MTTDSHNFERKTRLDPFLTGVFCVYAILTLIGIFRHEMWRDEIQSWLIARQSTSFGDLVTNLRHSGHTILWPAGLYVLSRFTADPTIMQVYHWFLAISTVAIFLKFSPFSRLQKALICFGYFFIYEYALISRDYVFGLLFLFLFCAVYDSGRQRPLLCAIILFLLANTSIYGVILSTGLAVMMALDFHTSRDQVKSAASRIILSAVILVAGLVLAILQMRPPPDSSLLAWTTHFDLKLFIKTLTLSWRAYVPIPNLALESPWNTNFMLHGTSENRILILIAMVASVGLLAYSILLFRKNLIILTFFLLGTVGIHAFCYLKYFGALRHHGHLLLMLLACCWLLRNQELRSASVQSAGDKIPRNRNLFLNGILLFQLFAGLSLFVLDFQRPFSQAKATASFIKAKDLNQQFLIGSEDVQVSPIAGFLDQFLYYPETGRTGGFIIFDNQKQTLKSEDLLENIRSMLQVKQSATMILNFCLTNPIEGLCIEKQGSFKGSIVADENFWVYTVHPGSCANPECE